MKLKFSLFTVALIAGSVALSTYSKAIFNLTIGDAAPMQEAPLKNLDGTTTNLKELKNENGLLVIFSCNTCPFVLGWENRYNTLHKIAEINKFGMVLVNSNEAKRNDDDSLEAMKRKLINPGYTMPYVIDEQHKLADAFFAKTTPHVFLFDKNMHLAYTGSIDDNYKDASAVTKSYLNDALIAIANGKEFDPNHTKATGCSIKRLKN
jgi:thioredoxin-related protein